MNVREILDYEMRSSPINRWLRHFILPGWAAELLGSYFAWKVNRKLARYNRYKKP